MNSSAWKLEPLTGRVVPKSPHILECDFCGGAGTVLGEGRNSNDPHIPEFRCETCDGAGQVQCADADCGCRDFDPPEDEQ